MKRDLSDHDLFVAQIRALQALNPAAHDALINWGAWSRHRCVGPGFARAHIFDQHDGDLDGYADENVEASTDAPAKAEAKLADTYVELPASILDERIHSPGGLPLEMRKVLRVAYVLQIPEYQQPRLASCITGDEFRYRLECCLRFVRKFI